MTRPARRTAAATALAFLLLLPGCWEVLTHQDEDTGTDWMAWDGAVEVNPGSLALEAAPGETAVAALTLSETSARAGVEVAAALEGAAEGLAIDPGRWSLALVPSGELEVRVSFSPSESTPSGSSELVLTTSGSPAEIRVPIATTVAAAR